MLTPIQFVVVDQSSAHLDMQDGIKKYPFQRNHFQLNKFKSPDEGDFKTLVTVLDDFKTVADGEVQGVLKSDIESMVYPYIYLSCNVNTGTN
jgi:hypothetical protein